METTWSDNMNRRISAKRVGPFISIGEDKQKQWDQIIAIEEDKRKQ